MGEILTDRVSRGDAGEICLMVDAGEICPVGIGDVELWGRDNDYGKAKGSGASPEKREKESTLPSWRQARQLEAADDPPRGNPGRRPANREMVPGKVGD